MVDMYRFRFEKGQFINADLVSQVDSYNVDIVFTKMSISKEDDSTGELVELLQNTKEFEAWDPLMFDFEVIIKHSNILFDNAKECLNCFIFDVIFDSSDAYGFFVASNLHTFIIFLSELYSDLSSIEKW